MAAGNAAPAAAPAAAEGDDPGGGGCRRRKRKFKFAEKNRKANVGFDARKVKDQYTFMAASKSHCRRKAEAAVIEEANAATETRGGKNFCSSNNS